MFLGEGGGSAEQARLRVCDDLDWDGRHAPMEATFGGEPAGKPRTRQCVGNKRAQSAGDHDAIRAMRERDVSGDTAERQAKAVECGDG